MRPERGALDRSDLLPMAALFAGSLALFAWAASTSVARALKPLGALGVYFDGSYYLEIARSFPLPFPPESLSYAGQAPLYPALIWAVRGLTPDALVDWGVAALSVSWLAGAAAPVAFYALCRTLGAAAFLPSLLFVFANPRWLPVASTAHPEPLAMVFAILALVFYFRRQLGVCAAMLTLCCLARYPAVLLTAALALGLVAERRRIDVRQLAVLAWPAVAIAAVNVYLYLRIPGFVSIWHSHATIWETHLTWPFAAALEHAAWFGSVSPQGLVMTCWVLALSLLAIGLGFARGSARELALPVWIALLVFFHVSLDGSEAFTDVTRLALLAWPPTVLILWRVLGAGLPAAVPAALCALLAASSLWFVRDNLGWALLIQQTGRDEQRLQSDVPVFRSFPQPVAGRRVSSGP
ncbi:MAG: hypothetical protein JRG76_03845 [Deltaproteobacteria bacterium]|nr:hypothetical protein [Deltaproteobacteria bacterium]MBW2413622.1 hypothetical protein [Deltaproteobacteria bacterium]